MIVGKIGKVLRRCGLMHVADFAKFQVQKLKNRRANAAFLRQHPGVVLPPDYLMFESFQLDYAKYFEGGKKTAQWLVELLAPYTDFQEKKVLDWGCGPGRVVRHLPELTPKNCRFFGTDYNPKTIVWCKEHLQNIDFQQNGIHPPLVYVNETFDVIYGISIFTHLSEKNHFLWFDELLRVAKRGAVLLLTTQGEAYAVKLEADEKQSFDAGKLVVRGKVVEGHRVFSAFQPPVFMQMVVAQKAEMLRHIPGKPQSWGIEQDVWILRKK